MTVTARSRFRLPALLLMLAVTAGCAMLSSGPELASPTGVKLTASEESPTMLQQLVLDMAVGTNGKAYLAWMAAKRDEKWEIRFSRSEDGGATWSGPLWSRKPAQGMFAAGAKLATGPAGQVYLAWREGNLGKTDIRILLARSLDGGKHWEEVPRELAAGDHLGFPYLQVGPNGSLYVAWLGGDESRRVLKIATSHDSGGTFTPKPAEIQPALSTSSRGITNPRLVSDGQGRVYAVWEEAANRRKDGGIYLSRSEDHGLIWSEPVLVSQSGANFRGAHMPQIAAASDGQVYLIWEQLDRRVVKLQNRTERAIDRLIYFNRSLDGGRTWLSRPVRLSHPSSPSLNRRVTSVAQIACDGRGHVYVAMVEGEHALSRRLLVFQSADFGATWTAPAEPGRTNLVKGQPIDFVLAHDGGGRLWMVWQEHAFGPRYGWFVLMNRSEDHGQKWANRAILMSGPTVGQTTNRDLALRAGEDGLVLAAWDHGERLYQPIALNRSTDSGKSWSPSRLPLD